MLPDDDAAGNITCDGRYVYQYDAWSRLVQINLVAEPPPGSPPGTAPEGDIVPGTAQLAGALVKHFTYDGLGRLVRVLSPYPEPGAAPPEGWTVAPVRSERLYYDGVRRIQEVYTDPLLALGESVAQGSASAQGAVGEGQEEEGQTLEGEEGQIESGTGEPGGEDPPGPPPNTFITYLEREYLWGPGDGITSGAGAGLDELVAIFDIDRRAWWTLLDASGDVVAVADDGASTAHGYGTDTPSTSTARLCAQFSYDAYGSLISTQGLHPFPDPRTGHKGLHLDRLDGGVADPLSGAPIARHEVGSAHAYFVRNRHYLPEMGRFVQRDVRESGGLLADIGGGAGVSGVSLAVHIFDGVGMYGAWRSDPMGLADPSGLGVVADAVDTYFTIAFDAGVIAHLLSTEYAINQYSDASWAEDWSQPDDWHTRLDSDWVGGVYEMVDINTSVDDTWGLVPFPGFDGPFARSTFPGFFRSGGKLTVNALKVGTRFLDRAGHHAFFRIYTRIFKGVMKEVLATVSKRFHKAYHPFVDKRMQEYIPGLPTIFGPGGAKKLVGWAKKNPKDVAKIPKMLVKSTSDFFTEHGKSFPEVDKRKFMNAIKAAIE